MEMNMEWPLYHSPASQCFRNNHACYFGFGVLLVLQVLNGSVSYFEEKNAGDAIAALKANLSAKANVKRDGVFKIIEARFLVPGDIVNVKLGDVVPADCELLGNGEELEVDQAALTGESLPVTIYSGEQLKMWNDDMWAAVEGPKDDMNL